MIGDRQARRWAAREGASGDPREGASGDPREGTSGDFH